MVTDIEAPSRPPLLNLRPRADGARLAVYQTYAETRLWRTKRRSLDTHAVNSLEGRAEAGASTTKHSRRSCPLYQAFLIAALGDQDTSLSFEQPRWAKKLHYRRKRPIVLILDRIDEH